ncbi:tetratricopeptide repeat protein [Candidatus Uhrbacteria bacterium]|nr:tetratricopeptide repeat protein [Candidatus Uhrbacteria bacterium]
MILNSISVLLIICSIIPIVVIIGRHLHILASIDVESIPAEREARVKDRLILERLKRRWKSAQTFITLVFEPLMKIYSLIVRKAQHVQGWLGEIREKQRRSAIIGGTHTMPEEDQDKKISALLERARAELADEKFEAAERTYIDVLSFNEKMLEPFMGLAEVYKHQREWEQTRDVLICACKLLKERGHEACYEGIYENEQLHYAEMLYDLSDVYQKLDQFSKALKCMKEAVELQKNNPKFLHGLVRIHIALGERLRAEKALDLLLKANPENGRVEELEQKIKVLSY